MPEALRQFIESNWPVSTDALATHFRVLSKSGNLADDLPKTPRELREQLDELFRTYQIQGDDSGWGPGKPRVKQEGLLF